jgi:3-deoxy-7-phosphoheptulonate synthase
MPDASRALWVAEPPSTGERPAERQVCDLTDLPAAQQPDWTSHPDLGCIRAELAALPSLVDRRDVEALRRSLARVQAGDAHVLHVGECAELFAMADAEHVRRRIRLYRSLAAHLSLRTGRETVLVARMAGQHAKPRSEPVETLADGSVVPSYRGDAVNGLAATPRERRADPWRLLTSYDRAKETLEQLAMCATTGHPAFVSHEALLRDYEEPMTRGGTAVYAGSAHLVWVGERSRQLDGWHVHWAASLANPVGVKVGPGASGADVLALAGTLNPRRTTGRLAIITRLGAAASHRLEEMMGAAGHVPPAAVWMCDPMHANTRLVAGVKVRLLSDIRAEVDTFVRVLGSAGRHPGGLHLEVTPDDVAECWDDPAPSTAGRGRPPCDPRLNAHQAHAVVEHFADALQRAHRNGNRR